MGTADGGVGGDSGLNAQLLQAGLGWVYALSV